MIYILISLFIISFILIYIHKRRLYSPLLVYVLFWSVIIFFSYLQLYDFFAVRDDTYYLFFGGVLLFIIGYVFQYSLLSKVSIKGIPSFAKGDYQISYSTLLFMILLALLFLITRIPRLFSLIASGKSMEAIRYMFYEYETDNQASKYTFYFQNFIVTPIIHSAAILLVLSLFIKQKNRSLRLVYLILTVVTTFLHLLISGGGRITIMNYIFHFVFTMLIFKRENTIPIKTRNRIIAIVVVCIIGFIAINAYRGKGNALKELVFEAYKYYAGCIKHFEIRIDKLGEIRDGGVAFIAGYLRPLFLVLGLIGIKPSNGYNVYISQNALLQSGVQIGTNTWYNAYVTLDYHFYLGFGMVGVLLGNFLYGIVCAYFMKKHEENNNVMTMAYLLLIIQGILTSMIRWQFSYPTYALSFIFLRMCFRKRKDNSV